MYGLGNISGSVNDVLCTTFDGLGLVVNAANWSGLSDDVKAVLCQNAVPFVAKTLNKTNIVADFGTGKPFKVVEDVDLYEVETPVGKVLLTSNTWQKLKTKGRVTDFGLIKPTLTQPLYVLKDTDKNRLIFVKTFKEGNRIVLFYSVVGDFGNVKNGSITNFEKKSYKDIIEKIESGDVRYIAPELGHGSNSTASAKNIPLVAVGSLLHGYTNLDKKSFNFDEKSLGAPGDTYVITDNRTRSKKDLDALKSLQKYDIQRLDKKALENFAESDPLLYEQIRADIVSSVAPSPDDTELETYASDTNRLATMYSDIKNAKFVNGGYFNNNGLGLTVNDKPAAVFNCPESQLVTQGYRPTYTRLADYSHLIDTADGAKTLKGYGFEQTTLQELINACKHYRQVERLAAHLKDKDKMQSAFNVWHWLHTNVKYDYDTPGEEEIRTPARVWADRGRGVDCDCLAVFTACLFICMGYRPKFEIVAFNNSPKYSHIYVNLDGAAIDRVLPVFLMRPSLISKTKIMEIPVYELSGVDGDAVNGILSKAVKKVRAAKNANTRAKAVATRAKAVATNTFQKKGGFFSKIGTNLSKAVKSGHLHGDEAASAILNGVYSSTLSKIFTHTATPEDSLNFRKTQVLITLQGVDPWAYKLGAVLMPHVAAIGDDGAYYFDNEEMAHVAADSDAELRALQLRGASDAELQGWLKKAVKKVGNAVKKVATSTANVVKTAAKATASTVKTAVKSTANAVKATANVVKAGAQAVTGHGSAAKETLKKAGQQAKSAVVDPLKNAVTTTKDVTKAVAQNIKTVAQVTIVNPLKETIKVAGKLFKVILVKLNPLMVLIRNSIRLLIAINFLGMGTRFNVGLMTEAEATKAGWSKDVWESAKKAVDRMKRLFKKLGGDVSKLEKSIRNGAKKKALFKKDIKPNAKIVETSDTDATLSGTGEIVYGINGLGDPGTIGSALAAAGAFLAKIWGWIKNIVPKIVKGARAITAITGGNSNSGNNGGGSTSNNAPASTPPVVVMPDGGGASESSSNSKLPLIIAAAVGAIGIGVVSMSGGKKKKRR